MNPEKPEIIINNCDIAATAVKPAQFPTGGLPEVAFVGKSNVGKSSLINAMLGRKRLVRTSSAPGKTRTINFFHVEEKLLFVDLPGYGYARVSKSESAKWGGMVDSYLKKRAELKRAYLLIDIRHEPGGHDKQLAEWFAHYEVPFTIIATKCDKISRNQLPKHLSVIRKALSLDAAPIAFSSETRAGRSELWGNILASVGDIVL
jgi:GTP-binding protein